jgi:hypothetical protein
MVAMNMMNAFIPLVAHRRYASELRLEVDPFPVNL